MHLHDAQQIADKTTKSFATRMQGITVNALPPENSNAVAGCTTLSLVHFLGPEAATVAMSFLELLGKSGLTPSKGFRIEMER